MKKEVIGHCACPTCKHPDAEVKEDKNGNAFMFCAMCATQVFTRNPHRDRLMRANMRPVTVTVTVPDPLPAVPTPPPAAPPAPGKKSPKPAPAAPPAPTPPPPPAPPAKKPSAWFSTLLAAPEEKS